jgi:hypothetical protein
LNLHQRRATISAARIWQCSIAAMSGAALRLTQRRGDARRPIDAARARPVVKRTKARHDADRSLKNYGKIVQQDQIG